MYKPDSMDVDNIVLSDDLLQLTEKIAKNVHEVWAEGRIREGWKYGPVKNSEKLETPLLVPYDELPESEKEFDRNTALNTLRLVIKLGYTIEKSDK